MLSLLVPGGDLFQRAANDSDAVIKLGSGDVQRRAKTDGAIAAADQYKSLFVCLQLQLIARLGGVQVHRAPQSLAADIADLLGELGVQFVQAVHQMRANGLRILHQLLLFDDLQDAREAHHINQIAAEGGIDARGLAEDIFQNFVHPVGGHKSAHLCLFAERQQVRFHKILVRPHAPGDADSGLHLVEDKQDIALVADGTELLQELFPEMVVATPCE